MSESKAKRQWLKPIVVPVMMGAFVVWFIFWADRRMNTMPLTVEQAYARYGPIRMPTPDDEATQQLVDTCESLFPLPSINDSLPPGMEWRDGPVGRSIFIGDVNKGRWSPESRINLRACISYLKSSQTDTALNDLARVRGKHWRQRFPLDFMNDNNARGAEEFIDTRGLHIILLARARYHYEERHGIDEAWDDLKTDLWLANLVELDYLSYFVVGISIERAVFEELNHLIREADICHSLARDIKETIDSRVDVRCRFPGILSGERVLAYSMLASCYADRPDGNGWLVLSDGPFEYMPGFYNTYTTRRHRLWNLATICHNRFDTVCSKIDLVCENLGKAASMGYLEGKAHIEYWEARNLIDGRDGPAIESFSYRTYKGTYVLIHRCLAYRNAALVNLALKILYKQDGQYPKTLPAKIEGWFGELPMDPFSGEPFKYRCEDGQSYTLWSVGPNGVDNNGAARFSGTRVLSEDETDVLFTLDRGEPFFDPVAIPMNSTSSMDTNGVQ